VEVVKQPVRFEAHDGAVEEGHHVGLFCFGMIIEADDVIAVFVADMDRWQHRQ
jgi:hypothetical protein